MVLFLSPNGSGLLALQSPCKEKHHTYFQLLSPSIISKILFSRDCLAITFSLYTAVIELTLSLYNLGFFLCIQIDLRFHIDLGINIQFISNNAIHVQGHISVISNRVLSEQSPWKKSSLLCRILIFNFLLGTASHR